jgi:hypothetical protein
MELTAFGRTQTVEQHLDDLCRMIPADSGLWCVLNAARSTIAVNEGFLRCYEEEDRVRQVGLDARSSFHRIWARIATRENLVPVDHPRMGGIWSQDRWLHNGIEARLMDDGWTQEIRGPDVIARVDGNHPEPVFDRGDASVLAWLARGLA